MSSILNLNDIKAIALNAGLNLKDNYSLDDLKKLTPENFSNIYVYHIFEQHNDRPSVLCFTKISNKGEKYASDYRININTGECTATSRIKTKIPIDIKNKIKTNNIFNNLCKSLSNDIKNPESNLPEPSLLENNENKIVELPFPDFTNLKISVPIFSPNKIESTPNIEFDYNINYDESKKSKTIPPIKKGRIWKQFFDSLIGYCLCCHSELNNSSFHGGHIISRNKGGSDDETNIVPICQSCNSSMHDINMIEYQKFHYPKNYETGLLKPFVEKRMTMSIDILDKIKAEFLIINNKDLIVADKYTELKKNLDNILISLIKENM